MSKAMHLKSFIPSAAAALAAGALLFSPLHAVEENPFDTPELSSSFQVADHHGKKGHKMKMMDTDGDGVISKEEFMSHAEKKFSKKDADGDGVITREEMKKGCKSGYKKDKEA